MVKLKKMISFVIFAFAFMIANCGLFLGNITAQNDSVENRLFKRIEYSVERGNLLKAKDNIKRVLKLNPRHEGALFYAGMILMNKGKREEAKLFFLKVLNSPKYGSKAREFLSEFKLYGIREQFSADLSKKIIGESYRDALSMCEEGLAVRSKDTQLLFHATYAATMSGMKEMANGYLQRFLKSSDSSVDSAELKSFVEAWFARGYSANESLDKLFVITDKRLLRRPVRTTIRDMIVNLKQLDKFEELIAREKKEAGADLNRLDRELISFYIDMKMNEKALRRINERPADSIEDNLLYIKLLNNTAREKKAMLVARQLLGSSKQDLRLFKSWIESYLMFYKRTEKTPQGTDEGGLQFVEMARNILNRTKSEMLVQSEPEFLLNLLKLTAIIDDKKHAIKLISQAVNISYSIKILPRLMETVDEFAMIDQPSAAIQILESAFNQMQDSIPIQIKLAELYLTTDRLDEAKNLLDSVLAVKPESIRAFMAWIDCVTALGNSDEAERALLIRLNNPDLLNIVKRQLDARLAILRLGSEQSESEQQEEDY